MLFEIKARLAKLGKKQIDLIPELHKRGITVSNPSELSNAINNLNRGPKGQAIASAANEILNDWEQDKQRSTIS